MKDEIVEQVRAVRAQIARECGYDPKRILEHANQTAARIPGLCYVTREELNSRRNSADAPKK
jgi:hypothetical protein